MLTNEMNHRTDLRLTKNYNHNYNYENNADLDLNFYIYSETSIKRTPSRNVC